MSCRRTSRLACAGASGASMRVSRSVATTRPAGPTAPHSQAAVLPVPAPTSSTRAPAPTPSAARMRRVPGSKKRVIDSSRSRSLANAASNTYCGGIARASCDLSDLSDFSVLEQRLFAPALARLRFAPRLVDLLENAVEVGARVVVNEAPRERRVRAQVAGLVELPDLVRVLGGEQLGRDSAAIRPDVLDV